MDAIQEGDRSTDHKYSRGCRDVNLCGERNMETCTSEHDRKNCSQCCSDRTCNGGRFRESNIEKTEVFILFIPIRYNYKEDSWLHAELFFVLVSMWFPGHQMATWKPCGVHVETTWCPPGKHMLSTFESIWCPHGNYPVFTSKPHGVHMETM